MKIFNLLFVTVLARKIGYKLAKTIAKDKLPADKHDLLINLTNMQQQLKKRIVLYNMSKHGHRRDISFDPSGLGCEWGFKRTIACKSAKVLYKNNHLAMEGLVIDPDESH